MSAWIMSQLITERPREYHFFIGDIEVASVKFYGGLARLTTKTDVEDFPNMSLALKEMHQRLSSPPPEGATTRQERESAQKGASDAEA